MGPCRKGARRFPQRTREDFGLPCVPSMWAASTQFRTFATYMSKANQRLTNSMNDQGSDAAPLATAGMLRG